MVQFLFYTMLLIYFLEIFPRISPRKKMLSERFVYTAKTQIEIVANVYLKNAEYDLISLLYTRLVFFFKFFFIRSRKFQRFYDNWRCV